VSVENYDPKSRHRIFNDPATIQALSNLRIRPSDLYFPTAEDLAPIAGDKLFFKDRLIERSLRLAEAVRAERNRLLREGESAPEIERNDVTFSTRPFTTKGRRAPLRPEEQPTPAALRAREIEEQLLRGKRQLVTERERRHERSLQLLERERQREQEQQREANLEKRERSQIFNERIRQQQIQRIWDYEAGAGGRRSRAREIGGKARLPRPIGGQLSTKSQIFAPITFPESR
jgi:hypothetical protein